MVDSVIKLLVGLGNPGPEYQATRHNAGFWFADLVAQQQSCRLATEGKFYGLLGRVSTTEADFRILKPLTYVNRSGQAVAAIVQYFAIDPAQILVVHDDMDIPAGQSRLKFGGGHAGHNGLRDIASAIGTQNFWRIRIGIDHPKDHSPVVEYVLKSPGQAQAKLIESALGQAAACLPDIIAGRFAPVMKQLHTQKIGGNEFTPPPAPPLDRSEERQKT